MMPVNYMGEAIMIGFDMIEARNDITIHAEITNGAETQALLNAEARLFDNYRRLHEIAGSYGATHREIGRGPMQVLAATWHRTLGGSCLVNVEQQSVCIQRGWLTDGPEHQLTEIGYGVLFGRSQMEVRRDLSG